MATGFGNTASGNHITEYRGEVMEDKKDGAKEIKVFVKELLPAYAGKITAADKEYSVSGGSGGYAGTVKAVNYIIATWRGDDTNRRYPPDVKAGEQVRVYSNQDSDVWYWEATARDDKLRRTEKVGQVAANTPEPSDLNEGNTYGWEADTKEKKTLKIYTSTSNGEEYKYTIVFDAANSTITVCDDGDNEFRVESKVPRVMMKNRDGCFVDLAKKNITIQAVEDLLFKAGRQVVWDFPAMTLMNTTGGGATVWNLKEFAINAQSFMVNSGCIGLNGAVEAQNIVSGDVHAASYSTLDSGYHPTYKSTAINPQNGATSNANNSPNILGGGSGNNRHCAAHEDVYAAFSIVANDLRRIDSKIGYGNNAGGVVSNAGSSIMNRNTGE